MYSGIVALLDVSSMDDSIKFYVEKMGFEMMRSWAPEGKVLWCKLDLGECSIMLQQSECPSDLGSLGKGVTLYAVVDDIYKYHETITSNGVEATDVERSFYGMRQSYVTDPDGYCLCFGVWEEVG